MAEKQQRGMALCSVAAAASGVCALTSSVGFAVGGTAVHQPTQNSVAGLRGAVQQKPETGNGLGSVVLGLASAGALAAAATVSKGARRSRMSMQSDKLGYGVSQGWDGGARDAIIQARTNFAMGLAGSDHHPGGRYEWDPACLSDRYPEHLAWYREAELKNGRVAMLAFAGLIVPDAVRLPFGGLDDPNLDFMNAHNKLIGPGLGEGPMWWLLVVSGILESIRFKQLGLGFEKLTVENAGDLGIKLFAPTTPEGWSLMKTKELKNGRLAMLAVSGCLTQGVLWESHHFPFIPQ